MSKYRKIDTRIWNDAKFRNLDDDGKFIFLFVLTNPAMTALGALPAPIAGLAHSLKWSEERFRKGFGELLSSGMVKVDEDAHLIALPNFLKYNAAENPNVVKAWSSSLDLIPECSLKDEIIQWAACSLRERPKSFGEAFAKSFGIPLPEPFRNGMPNQEPEPEQKPEPEHEPEPFNRALEEEGYVSTRESHEEIPYDPPETVEDGKAWLLRQGIPPARIETALHRLMAGKLFPSEIVKWKSEWRASA